MTDTKFPSLGFDPARGDVTAVQDIAKQMRDTGTYAEEAWGTLKSVEDQKDIWTGDAARAFADNLGDLPGYLDDAQQSLTKAGQALTTWSDQLASHQTRARDLEDQARTALQDYDNKSAAAEAARATSQQHPEDLQAWQQANQLTTQANQASDAVEAIRQRATELNETWQDDARICAEALDQAREHAPDRSVLDHIMNGLSAAKDWVVDNLDTIADIAGIISAISGALALIPVLTPVMGPIALASGSAALGLRSADMAANGKWDEPGAWVNLGADALGALPLVGPMARGGSTAVDSLRTVDGLTPAIRSGGDELLSQTRNVARNADQPARLFDKIGNSASNLAGGNPDTIARVAQGATGVAPVGMDLTGLPGSEYVGLASAGAQTTGSWGNTGQDFSALGGKLADFASEVGR